MKKNRPVKHGLSSTVEYSIWQGMKTRCNDKNHPSYYTYGGRGIRVCKRWLNDFGKFFLDMGPRPSKVHSIDRINHSGNYTPLNCRWATKKMQMRNRPFQAYRHPSIKSDAMKRRDRKTDPSLLKLISIMGNRNRLAIAIGVSRQAVNWWTKIPKRHKEKIKILRESLAEKD